MGECGQASVARSDSNEILFIAQNVYQIHISGGIVAVAGSASTHAWKKAKKSLANKSHAIYTAIHGLTQ
jgi:hypothetical protein